MDNVMCFFYWAIAIINLWAMQHIHSSSKPLESIGIYANRCLMITYVVSFFCVAIVFTLGIVVNILLQSDNQKKIVLLSISLVFSPISVLVDCLILYTLYRLSNKVKSEQNERISEVLRSS